MENRKRIYSLNLASYIMATTNLLPTLEIDENTNTIYFLFDECAAIKLAVRKYKGSNPLVPVWDLFGATRYLRESMRQKQEMAANDIK